MSSLIRNATAADRADARYTAERLRIESKEFLTEDDFAAIVALSDGAMLRLRAAKDAADLDARLARSLYEAEKRNQAQVENDRAFALSLRG